MKKIYIVDSSVLKKFPEYFPKESIKFKASEKNKNLKSASKLIEKLQKLGVDRNDVLMAVGGGNTLDVVGFVASIYMRGINWHAVPTTLLAMVDVCVGGKTGLNFGGQKNLIGTFHEPVKFEIKTEFLEKLSKEEFRNGMAEIIKHALIADEKFLNFLSKNSSKILNGNKDILDKMIKRSMKIKTKIVKNDPKEKGLRKILNYGHTFGHAIEVASNYKIKHGEAVAMGMVIMNEWSNTDKIISKKTKEILKKFGLPTVVPKKFSVEKLKKIAAGDKKKVGEKIDLVVLKKIGRAATVRFQNF